MSKKEPDKVEVRELPGKELNTQVLNRGHTLEMKDPDNSKAWIVANGRNSFVKNVENIL